MPVNYSINFGQRLIEQLAPDDRYPKRLAWLRVLIAGVRRIHGLFLAWKVGMELEASHNGQKMVLERMLNLTYYTNDVWASATDPTAGGHIYIENLSLVFANSPIWYRAEGQPQTRVFRFIAEGSSTGDPLWFQAETAGGYDFRVMVPSALTYTEAEMRARIDRYAVAGFTYIINTY